jgi:hypothetical protein
LPSRFARSLLGRADACWLRGRRWRSFFFLPKPLYQQGAGLAKQDWPVLRVLNQDGKGMSTDATHDMLPGVLWKIGQLRHRFASQNSANMGEQEEDSRCLWKLVLRV